MSRILAMAVLVLACAPALRAQAPTELERLAEMLREAAAECAARMPGGSVRLRVSPDDAHPAVMQVFAEELRRTGRGVLTGMEPADSRLAVDVRAMNSSTVSQDNSSYLRTVRLAIGVLAEAAREDSVLFSKEFELARTDTLDGEPPYGHRDLRADEETTWLDEILTPVIATAAAVIIVVLLFTVRGS